MDKAEFLKSTELFCDLSDDQIATLMGELLVVSYGEGDIIFSEGDEADAGYLVVDGKVVLSKRVGAEVEKTIYVADRGGFFGEMGMLERAARTATAVAETDVHLLRLGTDLYLRIVNEFPAIAARVLARLARILAHRLRLTNELYVSAVRWGLDVSGARGMNLQDIMDDYRTVEIGLRAGKTFRGEILRIESSVAGHEVTLKTAGGDIVMLPYHAIEHVSVDRKSAQFAGKEAS